MYPMKNMTDFKLDMYRLFPRIDEDEYLSTPPTNSFSHSVKSSSSTETSPESYPDVMRELFPSGSVLQSPVRPDQSPAKPDQTLLRLGERQQTDYFTITTGNNPTMPMAYDTPMTRRDRPITGRKIMTQDYKFDDTKTIYEEQQTPPNSQFYELFPSESRSQFDLAHTPQKFDYKASMDCPQYERKSNYISPRYQMSNDLNQKYQMSNDISPRYEMSSDMNRKYQLSNDNNLNQPKANNRSPEYQMLYEMSPKSQKTSNTRTEKYNKMPNTTTPRYDMMFNDTSPRYDRISENSTPNYSLHPNDTLRYESIYNEMSNNFNPVLSRMSNDFSPGYEKMSNDFSPGYEKMSNNSSRRMSNEFSNQMSNEFSPDYTQMSNYSRNQMLIDTPKYQQMSKDISNQMSNEFSPDYPQMSNYSRNQKSIDTPRYQQMSNDISPTNTLTDISSASIMSRSCSFASLTSQRISTPFREPLVTPGSSKNRNKLCTFCRKNGETPLVYMTHKVKERLDGKHVVTCPILRSLICSSCGASGDDAHTISYCPVLRSTNNGERIMSTTVTLKNTRVKSNGKRRY